MVSEMSTQQQMWQAFKAQLGANGYNTFEEFAVAEVARLRQTNALYRAALEFYANGIKTLIDPCHENANHVAPDNGSRAREVLKGEIPSFRDPHVRSGIVEPIRSVPIHSTPIPRQIVDVRFLPTITVDAFGGGTHEGHEPECNYPDALCICENPPPGTVHRVTIILRDGDDDA